MTLHVLEAVSGRDTGLGSSALPSALSLSRPAGAKAQGRALVTPAARAITAKDGLELPGTSGEENTYLLEPSHFRGESIEAQRGKLTSQDTQQ